MWIPLSPTTNTNPSHQKCEKNFFYGKQLSQSKSSEQLCEPVGRYFCLLYFMLDLDWLIIIIFLFTTARFKLSTPEQ